MFSTRLLRMRRKLSLAVCMICILIAVSGCAKTPSPIVENGIERAMTRVEQQAEASVKSKVPLEIISASNGQRIKSEYTGDGQVLLVDATVVVEQIDAVETFVLTSVEADEDLGKRVFLGKYADQAVGMMTDHGPTLWVLRGDNPDEIAAFFRWDDDPDEGRIQFECRKSIPSRYQHDFPLRKHVIASETDAQIALLELLQELRFPGAVFVDPYADSNQIGFYFLPQFTALPVVPDQHLLNSWPGIAGDASFTSEGLVEFGWWNPSSPSNAVTIDALITVDQALEIAKLGLGTVLRPRTDKSISEISLSHMYVYDSVASQFIAKPVWYFEMPSDPPQSAKDGADFQSDKDGEQPVYVEYTESFAVDVMTGMITVISTSSLLAE